MTATGRTATKRERLAEREEAILEAATKAFLRGGLKAAKMAEIARAADVAEGTLYLYFRNKEALFAAVVSRHWADLTAGAKKAAARPEDPLGKLEALAAYTLTRITGDWKLFELTFFVAHTGPAENGVGGWAGDDRRGYVAVFDAAVEAGVASGAFAPIAPAKALRDLFFGTIDYAARSSLARGEKPPAGTVPMLMTAMGAVLGTRGEAAQRPLETRLEAAVGRLETLLAER